MSRSTIVYLVMIVACAGGVWFILRAGYSLQAPVDLGGVWSIGGEDPTVAETLGETVTIEQSGRFVRLNFERGLSVDLKQNAKAIEYHASQDKLNLNFEGHDWKLTALGGNAQGPLIFQLIGPQKHTFTATRQELEKKNGHAEASPPANPKTSTADAGPNAP